MPIDHTTFNKTVQYSIALQLASYVASNRWQLWSQSLPSNLEIFSVVADMTLHHACIHYLDNFLFLAVHQWWRRRLYAGSGIPNLCAGCPGSEAQNGWPGMPYNFPRNPDQHTGQRATPTPGEAGKITSNDLGVGWQEVLHQAWSRALPWPHCISGTSRPGIPTWSVLPLALLETTTSGYQAVCGHLVVEMSTELLVRASPTCCWLSCILWCFGRLGLWCLCRQPGLVSTPVALGVAISVKELVPIATAAAIWGPQWAKMKHICFHSSLKMSSEGMHHIYKLHVGTVTHEEPRHCLMCMPCRVPDR